MPTIINMTLFCWAALPIAYDVRRPGFPDSRQRAEHRPIIMLTAKGDDMDKILGLEYGADDYITKPFNILEVKARIKAIMRRTL